MENAVWQNRNLTAQDVADEFDLEREVRKASSRKELRCPDSGCKCPIVRYCHGEVKGAYFAHLTNDKCDYADFDKSDTSVLRWLRLTLYKLFSELGYNVKCEVKILEHHYSQLYFELPDSSKIALEFGSKHTSANLTDSLAGEYAHIGVAVRWLVVSDTDYGIRENELYYIKRYLLNTSKHKEYIIISTDGTKVSQSRWDCNQYEYNGHRVFLNGFNELYAEEANLNLLTIHDGELTIKGFSDRYCLWLQRKRQAFEEEINRLKEKERKLAEQRKHALEVELKRQEEIAKGSAGRQIQANVTTQTQVISPIYTPRRSTQERPHPISKSYEARKAEIIGRMNQQEEQVRDSTDTRWIKCEQCGKIGEDSEFSRYGGEGHINLGVCNDCARKERR